MNEDEEIKALASRHGQLVARKFFQGGLTPSEEQELDQIRARLSEWEETRLAADLERLEAIAEKSKALADDIKKLRRWAEEQKLRRSPSPPSGQSEGRQSPDPSKQ